MIKQTKNKDKFIMHVQEQTIIKEAYEVMTP